MDGNSPICPVCEGTEYAKYRGFYFCIECETQSQVLREEVFDAPQGGTYGSVKVVATPPPTVKKGKDWTTWEGFNFVLRGQVEELLSLGVPVSFKNMILQLWARYLNRLEVAFTSKIDKLFPKIESCVHEKNLKLIYGIERKKAKKSQRKSFSRLLASTSGTFDDTVTSAGEAASNTNSSLMESDDDASDLDNIAESFKELSRGSWEEFSSSESEFEDDPGFIPEEHIVQGSKGAKKVIKKEHSKRPEKDEKKTAKKTVKNYQNPNLLTRAKLLALQYIGLLHMTECSVQPSDLLRWLREGHVSYQKVYHFFPPDYFLQGRDVSMFSPSSQIPLYHTLLKTTSQLMEFMGIDYWPTPNMLELISRYVKELNLPVMLSTLATRLIAVAPNSLQWSHKKDMPNYEGRAMAIIIVILKLLFGLDDRTEHKISSTAKAVNKLVEENTSEGKERPFPTVFVWDDWAAYIVCRNALLIRHHFLTNNLLLPESGINPELFVDFITQYKRKHIKDEEKVIQIKNTKNSTEMVDSLMYSMKKLADIDPPKHKIIYFPPSMTPKSDYIGCILAAHTEDELPMDVLGQNFSVTDTSFFLRPRPYVAFAKGIGVNIVLQQKSARKKIDELKMFKNCIDTRVYETKIRRLPLVLKIFSDDEVKRENESAACTKRSKKSSSKGSHKKMKSNQQFENASRSVSECSRLELNSSVGQVSDAQVVDSSASIVGPVNDKSNTNGKVKSTSGVSRKTMALLSSYLKQNNIKERKSKTGSTINRTSNSFISKDIMSSQSKSKIGKNKRVKKREKMMKFDLYLPYSEYWRFDGVVDMSLTNEVFEFDVVSKFPVNFNWLLTECAHMLEMSKKELYKEVLAVEIACASVNAL